MNKPLINILTRTSNRPNGFKGCYDSIHNQTYKNIKHLVSYDDVKDLNYLNNYKNIDLCKINKLKLIYFDESKNPNTGKYSPHNLYFNEMHKMVNSGWIMYLDDDDYFVDENCIEEIVKIINKSDEDTLIFWQFKLGNNLILPQKIDIYNKPKIGKIGGSTFIFNKKYITNWDGWKCGDFRLVTKLYDKIPKKYFLKKILVLSPKPGLGNKKDA